MFVTLEEQHMVKALVERYQGSTFQKNFRMCMGSLCCCIPFFSDHGMKYFENSQGNRTLLKIKRAPEPEDIFFENLTASDYDRFIKAL